MIKINAIWDAEGYNQWGTKYIYPRPCLSCGSDMPVGNMYGMGGRCKNKECPEFDKPLPNP